MATISEREAAPAQQSSMTASWPANPAPLGLSGFGLTTVVLSFINANLIGTGATPVVLGMALAFGGGCQLLAGMWEFRTGNVFGATAFSSYGAFWISFWALVNFNVAGIAGNEVNSALGLYLWAWGIFTGMLFLCTFSSPKAIQLLFLLLTVTFILLGIGAAGGHANITHAGGYVGIVTGGLALYIAAADIMEHSYGRSVLPVGK